MKSPYSIRDLILLAHLSFYIGQMPKLPRLIEKLPVSLEGYKQLFMISDYLIMKLVKVSG